MKLGWHLLLVLMPKMDKIGLILSVAPIYKYIPNIRIVKLPLVYIPDISERIILDTLFLNFYIHTIYNLPTPEIISPTLILANCEGKRSSVTPKLTIFCHTSFPSSFGPSANFGFFSVPVFFGTPFTRLLQNLHMMKLSFVFNNLLKDLYSTSFLQQIQVFW